VVILDPRRGRPRPGALLLSRVAITSVVLAVVVAACGSASSVPDQPSALAVAPDYSLAITSHRSGETVVDANVLIEGRAPAGATVTLDRSFETDGHVKADGQGAWSMALRLDDGENRLRFRIDDDESTAIDFVLDLVRVPTPDAAPTTTPEPTFGPTGPTTEATVVRVTDGDTIVVAYGGSEYRVRYIGMDSPETTDPNSPVEWMGPQATAANEALVAGKTVILEKDVRETDDFGRLLRYVWLTNGTAWTLVNLELVRQGFASLATYPPDVKYVDLIRHAEFEARSASLGLWGAPPPTPTLAPPPTPVPFVNEPEPAADCHPSYDPCLPIVGDLDCADVRALGAAPVTVIGPDEYRLDGEGDGRGCE
jgi:endonuclease YncB( thermonuclease family)